MSTQLKLRHITTAADGRDFAIDWQNWVSERDLSYSELAEWGEFFAAIVEEFPELADEFQENGIPT